MTTTMTTTTTTTTNASANPTGYVSARGFIETLVSPDTLRLASLASGKAPKGPSEGVIARAIARGRETEALAAIQEGRPADMTAADARTIQRIEERHDARREKHAVLKTGHNVLLGLCLGEIDIRRK